MIVYILTNRVNGKQYVGQTTQTVQQRWQAHKSAARSPKSFATAVNRAIRKYGASAFAIEAIPMPEGSTREQLDAEERRKIAELNTLVPNGYNLCSGGQLSRALSPETRAKMSASRIGKKASAAARANMSAARKGTRMSPEAIARMAATKRGSRLSEEHKSKIQAAMVGRTFTPEWRAKLSASAQNRSEATRAKIRANQLGRKHSEQTLVRLRAAQQRRWAKVREAAANS